MTNTYAKFQPVTIAVLAAITILVMGASAHAGTDKTLVSWVTITDKNVRAGSVLTVQAGPEFDGIIFAERAPRRWMAGSHGFQRTGENPESFPEETADKNTQVQMAIVYKGNQVSIYRDGKGYASYKTKNIDILGRKHNVVVFGLRHIGGDGSIAGWIDDARIYDKALTVDQIKSLSPNKASSIKPYAWWDFEGDKITDCAGRYPHHKTAGGAKLSKGKLVLGKGSTVVCATSKEAAKIARRGGPIFTGPYVPETPRFPAKPPANWLTYHLVHPGPGRAMPGDPNPAFFYKGRYHMHYIYRNHTGFVFAHVSGTDMVHWKWHKTVLAPPTTGHGMFSGTGFFTKEGKAAMIYHGQGSGRNWIAYAQDDLMDKWSKPESLEPKGPDGKPAKIRHWDPDCWRIGDTYYALSGGGDPELMKSDDLKSWKYLGKLLHKDYPKKFPITRKEDISCANMFKIGNKWMLLCISHRLGCRYYLGNFKDEKYLPEFHAMMSWNTNNFFAPESILSKDGRRVMWAWLIRGCAPGGVQSLPRELELPEDGVLRIRPLRELKKLRTDEKAQNGITVKDGATCPLKNVSGNAYELKLVIKAPKGNVKEFGLDVMGDKEFKSKQRIAVNPAKKTLKVGPVTAPFELKAGEDLTLRVFIDKNLIEVFANDRQGVTHPAKTSLDNTAAKLFSEGGELKVESATSWNMKSIYAEKTAAPKPAAGAGFVDSFEGKLDPGWRWLREEKKDWRIKDGGLEICVRPGVAHNVKNALVRAAPDPAKGAYTVDVTITSHTVPTNQFEQAGITWYHNGKPVMKLVKELVHGKLMIIPGAKRMKAKTVQLRYVIDGKSWIAQYRPDARGDFLTAGKGRMRGPGKHEVSIQCYNGPPNADHWIRFDDFRITPIKK